MRSPENTTTLEPEVAQWKESVEQKFGDISETNPVSYDRVCQFLRKLNPKLHRAYSTAGSFGYEIFFTNINDLIGNIEYRRAKWQRRNQDKEKFAIKNWNEVKLEGGEYLPPELGLTSAEINDCLKRIIPEKLLYDLNLGKIKFSPMFLMADSRIIAEQEFLSDSENKDQKVRGQTETVIMEEQQDGEKRIQRYNNEIQIYSFKYEDCPEYLNPNEPDWLKKYFIGTIIHELCHCVKNDLLTYSDFKELKEICQQEKSGQGCTKYSQSFFNQAKESDIKDEQYTEEAAELLRLYVTDYKYLSDNFPDRTKWIKIKFPEIKANSLKNIFE